MEIKDQIVGTIKDVDDDIGGTERLNTQAYIYRQILQIEKLVPLITYGGKDAFIMAVELLEKMVRAKLKETSYSEEKKKFLQKHHQEIDPLVREYNLLFNSFKTQDKHRAQIMLDKIEKKDIDKWLEIFGLIMDGLYMSGYTFERYIEDWIGGKPESD